MATATAPLPGRNGTPRGANSASGASASQSGHPAQRRGSSPATTEIPLLVGREEGDFIVYDDVPIWTEHYSRAVGQRFDRDDLERIVARCNERIADTNDYAMLAVRHTKDDPSAEPPPIVGFGGPYHVGTYGKKNPKATIFARFVCYKDDREVVRRHPRVSVEYAYTKNDPKGGYFDVISLLGAESPELDLGIRYAKRFAADPNLCIGRYSRTVEFLDPGGDDEADDQGDGDAGDDGDTARYAADAAPGGSNTYVPGGTGGTGGKSGKKKSKKSGQGGSGGMNGSQPNNSTQHATHSKINTGDGSKNTTSSASGTADLIPQSQQGGPISGGVNGQSHGAPFRGGDSQATYGGSAAGGGANGVDSQRGSLSQVDLAQIVAAIQPSIEECVRRIIPAPQPPPVENEGGFGGLSGGNSGGDLNEDGDGTTAEYSDLDQDGDDDSDDFDNDADDSNDAYDNPGSSPLAGSQNAGGMDGGKDASASDLGKPPAKKTKKTPKKERFSMSANANPNTGANSNDAVEVARYKKQVADLTTERDKAIADREEYRAKYEKSDRAAADSNALVEQLKGRVDAIDADRRQSARYAKLMTLQNEGFTFKLDEELKDCETMSDDEFARHETRVRANYQRVPMDTLPMDRTRFVGPRGNLPTTEDRTKYSKEAQTAVFRAKQNGKELEYGDALKAIYEKAGKDIPTPNVYAVG